MKVKRKQRDAAAQDQPADESSIDLEQFLREAEQEQRDDVEPSPGVFAGLRNRRSASKADATPEGGRRWGWRGSRETSTSDAHQWTNGSQWRARAMTAGMVAAMVAGPVALGMQMFQGDPVVRSTASGYDERMMNRRDVAGERARQTVRAWLSASASDQGAVSRLVPGLDPNSVSFPEKASRVGDVQVTQLLPSGPGVWTATVAADVTADGSKTAVHRYFQVPVAVSGSVNASAQPLTLPAEVPGPGMRVPQVRASYPNSVAQSDPAYGMAAQFLSALLTGQDNIGLYERPGTSIAAITNTPWKSVRITRLDVDNSRALGLVRVDDTKVHVLATVALSAQEPKNGSVDAKSESSATYALTLTSRAGRWEISSLDAAPQLNTPSPTSASSTK